MNKSAQMNGEVEVVAADNAYSDLFKDARLAVFGTTPVGNAYAYLKRRAEFARAIDV